MSQADKRGGRRRGGGEALPLGARRHPLVTAVGRRLARRCDVPGGATLVLGCSGGADSVALLICCAALARRGHRMGADGPALRPIAVHVNHNLRSGAAADESFVRGVCTRLDVPYRIAQVHPGNEPGNTAANARRLRYTALLREARAAGASHVATAHHAEDQLETVLIALHRGAGLDGLSGMRWRTPLDSARSEPVHLVRPLLDQSKASCVALCHAADIEFREDPTNEDPRTLRGRLRREVVPVLESLWPDSARRVAATADLLESANQAVKGVVADVFGPTSERTWPRDRLRTLPAHLIAAGLRRAALDHLGAPSDELGQEQLLRAAEAVASSQRRPRTFHWPHGLAVTVDVSTVALRHRPDDDADGRPAGAVEVRTQSPQAARSSDAVRSS